MLDSGEGDSAKLALLLFLTGRLMGCLPDPTVLNGLIATLWFSYETKGCSAALHVKAGIMGTRPLFGRRYK